MQLEEQPQAAHEFVVRKGSRAAGVRISDLPLGPTAWLALVVRHGNATRPAGSLKLAADDRVMVLADDGERAALTELFTRRLP